MPPIEATKKPLTLTEGRLGLTHRRPSYWNTSFTKICLGLKIDNLFKFIAINRDANSLYSWVITDGQNRSTSLNREVWKLPIGSKASLQLN